MAILCPVKINTNSVTLEYGLWIQETSGFSAREWIKNSMHYRTLEDFANDYRCNGIIVLSDIFVSIKEADKYLMDKERQINSDDNLLYEIIYGSDKYKTVYLTDTKNIVCAIINFEPKSSMKNIKENKSMKMMNEARVTVNTLMKLDNNLWDELDVGSGSELWADKEKLNAYREAVKEFLDKKGITSISGVIRDKLTDENYHTLNKILEELGMYDALNENQTKLKKNKLMKTLNEKKIDLEERKDALAEFLGLNEEEKEEIEEGYREEELEYDGESYLVVDDDEADDIFYDYEKELIDELGMDAFSKSFQLWIIDNALDTDFFDEAKEESDRFYCEDIVNEDDDEFGNRLVAECYDRKIIKDKDFEEDESGDVDYTQCKIDTDDLIDMMVEDMADDYDDNVEWYRDNFGDEDLAQLVNEKNLLDVDAVIDEVKNTDTRGPALAGYDGVENEIKVNGTWFYIYRTN